MQSSGQGEIEFYKQLEKELNNKLLSITNTLPYITKCGETLDTHSSQVTAVRERSTKLLDCLDLANKDDTATIANKKIELEERLDNMEDQMYMLVLTMKEHCLDLTSLTDEMVLINNRFTKDNSKFDNKNGGERNG